MAHCSSFDKGQSAPPCIKGQTLRPSSGFHYSCFLGEPHFIHFLCSLMSLLITFTAGFFLNIELELGNARQVHIDTKTYPPPPPGILSLSGSHSISLLSFLSFFFKLSFLKWWPTLTDSVSLFHICCCCCCCKYYQGSLVSGSLFPWHMESFIFWLL